MAFTRTSIEDFAVNNPVYTAAKVTAFVADDLGAATATLATIYDSPTGGGTLQNPQFLDNLGKWRRPVYYDQDIVLFVEPNGFPAHFLGLLQRNESASFNVEPFFADPGQTQYVLQLADCFTEAGIRIEVDGVSQEPIRAYTVDADDHRTVTFTQPFIGGERVHIIHQATPSILRVPGAGTVTSTTITNDPADQVLILSKIGGQAVVPYLAKLDEVPYGGRDNVLVQGEFEPGDTEASSFWYDETSSETPDQAMIYKPSGQAMVQPGRYKRLNNGSWFFLKHFGAVMDGVADDSDAMQAALDWMRTKGGMLLLGEGTIRLTKPMRYYTSTVQNGPLVVGAGGEKTTVIYDFANGTSLFKVRNTVSSVFMEGGGFFDFTVRGPVDNNGNKIYGLFTQQAAFDLGGWINFEIKGVRIEKIRGHGIWTPTQYASVNFPTDPVDFANDKPWVVVDRARHTGRPCRLWARVHSATGAITGFTVNRSGSGYVDGAAVHVYGCGTGFAGTVVTSLSTTGTITNGDRNVTNLASTDGVQPGQDISGTGIPNSAVVEAVTGPNSVRMNLPATASTVGVALTIAPQGGGVMRVNISNAGANYYEEQDHLFDNPDPFTCGLVDMSRCVIQDLDGVGVMIPHFASSGWRLTLNYIISCRQGGVLTGGNNSAFENNSISFNGMSEGAGWYPGIWVARSISSPQNNFIHSNELDSNTYTGVLLDGTTGVTIKANRFNSWVTIYLEQTDWDQQIPYAQIKIDTGNRRVSNTSFMIEQNSHRWQPVGGSVPTSGCNTTAGVAIITGLQSSPLGSSTFKVGARVQILDLTGTPITFNAGAFTEAHITVVDYPGGTLTLDRTPDSTITGATVKVLISDEFVLFVDLGRNSNSSIGSVRDPFVSGVATGNQEKFANFRSQDRFGAQFDVTEGSFRKRGSPGLNAATTYIDPAHPISIPATPTTLIVPWDPYLDPESLLEQVPPKSGNYTGRYVCSISGIFEFSGCITLETSAAGDNIVLELLVEYDDIDTAGSVTTTLVSGRRMNHVCVGTSSIGLGEAIPFVLSGAVTIFDTYIGSEQPTEYPGAGEDGLIWWNPLAETYKRWNGTTLLWENVAGTFTKTFERNIRLSFRLSSDSASPIPLDTNSSSYNWGTWKRLG